MKSLHEVSIVKYFYGHVQQSVQIDKPFPGWVVHGIAFPTFIY